MKKKPPIKFTRYANFTTEMRDRIVEDFEYNTAIYPADQAVSVTAVDTFGLSDRQWNGKIGSDVFAAVLACLVMEGVLLLVESKGSGKIVRKIDV